uniref:XRE family transcriptional regulator n=1 Tax=uncultured bacterium Contig643 TaxID=1393602 RepID=W0FKS6_9BACT|nr:XRE family transcriptional regulator [uncultured bacterium Contig643]
MYLGEIIKEYRKKHGLSMQTFSDRANLSKAYISQLENNRNPKTGDPIVPSVETFVKIAAAMNISVDDLLNAVDENQPLVINPERSGKDLGQLIMTDDEAVDYHIDALAELIGLEYDDIKRAIDFALEMKGRK